MPCRNIQTAAQPERKQLKGATMRQSDKIRMSYEDMISKLPEDKKVKRLMDALVSSDIQFIKSEDEKETLEDEIRKLKKELSAAKAEMSGLKQQQEKKKSIRPGEIEVYSSEKITTVLDYEEDEGMPYFKIPNKEEANELLIDSGLALCEYDIKIHIEILK